MTSDRSNNSGCLFPFGDDLLALLVFSHIVDENQKQEKLEEDLEEYEENQNDESLDDIDDDYDEWDQ